MIKVEHTKTHIVDRPNGTASGKHTLHESVLVTDAKLVLVGCDPKESVLAKYNTIGGISYSNGKATLAGTYYQPIFISETEKIEVGDWVYHPKTKSILQVGKEGWLNAVQSGSNTYSKILALPEHFSPQQLQMIVDGKLKDGDKVLVECENIDTKLNWENEEMFKDRHINSPLVVIKLNPHITIYPVGEKMYTIKEIIDELKYGLSQYGCKNELSGKWVLEDNIYYILNGLNKM